MLSALLDPTAMTVVCHICERGQEVARHMAGQTTWHGGPNVLHQPRIAGQTHMAGAESWTHWVGVLPEEYDKVERRAREVRGDQRGIRVADVRN